MCHCVAGPWPDGDWGSESFRPEAALPVLPPPPTATYPSGQTAVATPPLLWLKTVCLVGSGASLPFAPFGPGGPARACPVLKSSASSEPVLTLDEVTAPF